MKKLVCNSILILIGFVFFVGCTKTELACNKDFPKQIGEYAKKKSEHYKQLPTMESNLMITYTGNKRWATANYVTYKDELSAKEDFERGKSMERIDYQMGDINGLYKTDVFSNTYNLSFAWREGNINKIITITKPEQGEDNEKHSKDEMLLFIKAYKGL